MSSSRQFQQHPDPRISIQAPFSADQYKLQLGEGDLKLAYDRKVVGCCNCLPMAVPYPLRTETTIHHNLEISDNYFSPQKGCFGK